MSSRRRWIIMGLLALLLTGTAAGAPNVLRRWDAFTVEHVEVRGTRYLAAYDALVQSGITRESNVFDDFAPWRSKLLEHPLVLDAKIERHLPNTIRVAITERSEEHTSELQSPCNLVCRLLLEKKKKK